MSDEPGAWPGSGAASSEETESAIGREVKAAAREATEHVRQHLQNGIDQATLSQLHAEAARLSRLAGSGDPFAASMDMRELRNRIRRLLDRKLWPRQQADLYLLLGCLHEMMGTTAYQLGVPAAAAQLLQTGLTYADAINDHPLRTRLRANLSAIMN